MLQQFIRQWFVFDCISFVFDCFSCYWPLHYPFSVYLLCFFVAVFAFKDIHFIRVQMLLYCDSECSLLNVVTMKFGRTLVVINLRMYFIYYLVSSCHLADVV